MSLAICNPTTSKKVPAKKKNKSQEEMIMESLPLVKFLAQRLQSRLPASIEIDDLISAGVIVKSPFVARFNSAEPSPQVPRSCWLTLSPPWSETRCLCSWPMWACRGGRPVRSPRRGRSPCPTRARRLGSCLGSLTT